MLMEIIYLTFAKGGWFTLPVNVWRKATTTISNKYSVNFLLKKQQIDDNNNSNGKDDNNDNSDRKQKPLLRKWWFLLKTDDVRKFLWIPLEIT